MADDFAQLVKQQADIVRIVGEYLKLRKTGAQNYTGLCPFHKEKTGSSQRERDAWVLLLLRVPREGRCLQLCDEDGGVELSRGGARGGNEDWSAAAQTGVQYAGGGAPIREQSGLRRQLIDLHEAATQYFEARLKAPEAARAREYLTERGVTAETIKTFRIGYAPDDFNAMREKMKQHFAEDVLRASGLFSSKEKSDDGLPTGELYARFRKRITFPIANEAGKVIAFTARALDATDDKGREVAKYLNSPETVLYTKGNVLFNLDKAKAEMRKNDFAVLVEGQMDCISVYMAGIRNVLAISGTAFTETQVRLLGRFTKRVIVNFDPDTAGATAAEKSIALLTEEDFDVKLVTLGGGLDPDRFVREQGIQAYGAALRGAKRHSDYLIDRARQLFPGQSAEAKVSAMNFLLPHIRRMAHPIRRNQFAEDAANKLGIDSALMRQELKQAAAHRLASVPAQRHPQQPDSVERLLLRALVLPDDDPARLVAAGQLAQHPEWYDGLPSSALFDALAHGSCPANPLDAAPDEASRIMLTHALEVNVREIPTPEYSPRTTVSLSEHVQNALSTLAVRYLERRSRELRQLITETQRQGDNEMLRKLQIEHFKINRDLLNR